MRPGISWGGPGDSPHTPAASTVPEDFKSRVPHMISAPGGEDNPVLVSHNTQHQVIAKDFALQTILFTLAHSERKKHSKCRIFT